MFNLLSVIQIRFSGKSTRCKYSLVHFKMSSCGDHEMYDIVCKTIPIPIGIHRKPKLVRMANAASWYSRIWTHTSTKIGTVYSELQVISHRRLAAVYYLFLISTPYITALITSSNTMWYSLLHVVFIIFSAKHKNDVSTRHGLVKGSCCL